MRILFVFPNYAPVGGGGMPIGLSILIGIAKSKGHEVMLFDTSFKLKSYWYNPYTSFIKIQDDYSFNNDRSLSMEDIVELFREKVSDFNPDLICISSLTPTHEIGIKLIEGIKNKKHHLIIFGGVHSTVCSEEVIQHKNVDMICISEGEVAFSELLDCLQSGENYTNINNLWIKKNGTIIRNPIGTAINADSIPLCDFSLFESEHFYKPFKGQKMRSARVEVSRGCIYPCSYCSNKYLQGLSKGHGRFFRYKSVSKVIDELLLYKELYNLEMLFLKDEVFLFLPDQWLAEFSVEYKSRINLPFFCQSTAKDINEKKVKLLKDVNCVAVAIGAEVGNEKFRKNILKKPISNDEIKKAVELLVKNGIRVSVYFMIGLPYETRDLIFETIEFQRELYEIGCSPSQINCFHPLPGCELTDIAKREGFFRKDFDHKMTTTIAGLDMPQLSSKEIEGLHRTFSAYTKVEKWMYPIVKMCEEGAGKEIQILEVLNSHYVS